MSDGPPPLATYGLWKRYRGGIDALRDVDLEIAAGTTTALVGPNGAGKSTLIRAWVGFERPTGGRVSVAGVDPWRHRAEALRLIGYVPQGGALYRDLTVAQHLDLASTLRPGFDRAGAAARLESLDVPLRRHPTTLSGGQQAQVGLALALGTRAPILLLDEPLASLDPLARREFLNVLVAAVRDSGATAVLASHIVTDVAHACDRLIVLGDGRVRLHDRIDTAVASHRLAPIGEPPRGWESVAVFPGEDGSDQQLMWATDAADLGEPSLRPAPLEEVVIGHLAARQASPGGSTWRRAS
jgi:ABC-2 type transport system ATP-binding protein